MPLTYANDAGGGASPYRLAMIALVAVCIPVAVGVTTTTFYVLFGFQILAMIGLLMVPVWLLLLLGAAVLLALATHHNPRAPSPDERIGRLMNWTIAVTLLSFPAALGCAVAGAIAPSRFDVQVTNAGTAPVQNVQLDLAGKRLSVGILAPGQTWLGSFRPASGPATISWTVAGSSHRKQLSDDTDQDSLWTGASFTVNNDQATWN